MCMCIMVTVCVQDNMVSFNEYMEHVVGKGWGGRLLLNHSDSSPSLCLPRYLYLTTLPSLCLPRCLWLTLCGLQDTRN